MAHFRRVFAACGPVGTRSRAIRGSTSDDRVGCSASDGRCAPALDVSTRLLPFLPARSRVPMVFGPFHYCAFCERAAPDAPETIDDQRRCTGCRDRTIYGGSRGSASLLWGLSSVDCGRGDYFIFFKGDGVAIFAVMRKVLIWLNARRRKLADQHASAERSLPCKALVTPSAQRVAEWKKKTE